MAGKHSPATIVILAAARGDVPKARAGLPTTRVTGLAALERDGGTGRDAEFALAIEPEWLASRQALRTALVRARRAAPGLEAAVLRGVPLAHHSVLADEGIRVVVVDAFADVGRGCRRPAPAGWPCRNPAWGLWEVKACPPRRSPAWAWLPGLPAPRRGGLHVCGADDAGTGGRRLGRLLDWASRGVAAGRAEAVALADLPAILEGRRPASLAASVLRAA